MKKTLLLIIPLFFLFVGCDDNTPTNDDDVDDMMSLDWILLKKGVDMEFLVESCEGYEGWDCEYDENEDSTYYCGGYILSTYNSVLEDYYLYEYRLYWNEDLSICSSDSDCVEEELGSYDIFIPSHIPNYIFIPSHTPVEESACSCENNSFHPSCYTPLDTTMVFNGKEVSFEKMGWLDRDYNSKEEFIHYYPSDGYITFPDDNSGSQNDFIGFLDISEWKVVDYQRKE